MLSELGSVEIEASLAFPDREADGGLALPAHLAQLVSADEHIALLRNPNRFDQVQRKSNLLDEGVAAVFGLAGGEAELVALSFHAGKFSPAESAMADTELLLVDDDNDACASMSDIFLDIGYTVDMAYDGPGALELSGRHHYRLALLDYKMPGMDGLELCRRLKNTQPSVVVALITAFSSIGAATEAGVRCSLVKPVNFSIRMPLVDEVVHRRVDNTPVEVESAVA